MKVGNSPVNRRVTVICEVKGLSWLLDSWFFAPFHWCLIWIFQFGAQYSTFGGLSLSMVI